MKNFYFLFLFPFSLSACVPNEASYDTFLGHKAITDVDCSRARGANQSPEEYENAYFLKRFHSSFEHQGESGVVKEMNAECVLRQFSNEEIQYWSTKEDPVAQFLEVYNSFKTRNNICKNIDRNKSILIKSSNNLININGIDKKFRRVPESIFMLKLIEEKCLNNFNHHYDEILKYENYFYTLGYEE